MPEERPVGGEPDKSKVLVFTTCYNERQNIGPLIDQIVEAVPAADILVVDDNSPDGTWEIIQAKAKRYPRLRSVMRPRKLGIGSAHKYALFYAMREGYETLVTMDADFSHDPKKIPELLRAHGKNVFVTGSRYCRGGTSDYSGYRNVVSRIGNIVARRALNVGLRELTTYFRVFDVNSLRRLPLRHVHAAGYSYGVQLIYYLRKAGVELREVPIHFADRNRGASKIPRMQILTSAADLLILVLRRLNFFRDLEPDIFVDDACANCHDRALAATSVNARFRPPAVANQRGKADGCGDPVFVCLRCGLQQTPRSAQRRRLKEFAAPFPSKISRSV
ncbi:MAG TPA: polyprenol monophosphomannose synthase [Xanthobacteraceae bacterium]|nr:polyprenol monophosphomannose synthase [Xanthobacteraceae bacterium]